MKFTLTTLAVLIGCVTVHGQPLKVGTVNNRAVALAFYNSDHWAGILKAKRSEQHAAKQAGNNQRVAELDKWGQAQQDLAHSQVFGSAPITNVLEHLAPAFPEIAKAAGVAVIASDVHYVGTSVQQVDVTMNLLDWLKATDRTRSMVKSLLQGGIPSSGMTHKH